MQYSKDSQQHASEDSLFILNIIRLIPGRKIITVNLNYNIEEFDINEKGVVGYSKEHENIFLKRIDNAFKNENTFIVRQFIPNSEEKIKLKNGKEIMMPWKALYGFVLHEDNIISIPAEDVENSFIHAQSRNPIEPEKFIIYKNFSEFLSDDILKQLKKD